MAEYVLLSPYLKPIGFLSMNNQAGSTFFWSDTITQQIADDGSTNDDPTTLVSMTMNNIDEKANHKLWNHTISLSFENSIAGKQVTAGYYILYTDPSNGRDYLMYLYDVTEDTDVSGTKFRTANGSNAAIFEGGANYPKAKTFTNASLKDIASYVFSGFNWSLIIPDDNSIKMNYEIDGNTTTTAIIQDLIVKFDLEVDAYVSLSPSGQIRKRIVEFGRLGEDNHQLIRYGSLSKGFESISQQWVSSTLFTKLYIKGVDDTSPASVNQNNNFVVDDDANMLYNPVGATAVKPTYLEGTIESTVLKEPQALLDWGKKQLKVLNHPRANYVVTALHDMNGAIGDTIRVQDMTANPPILEESRVIQRQISFSSPETNTVTLGEFTALVATSTPSVFKQLNSITVDVTEVRTKAENAVTVAQDANDAALTATKEATAATALAQVAKKGADTAQEAASQAVVSANNAITDAGIASEAAGQAQTAAANAQSDATTANSMAAKAKTSADQATVNASNAILNAKNAQSSADSAKASADSANSLATQASDDLVAVKSDVNKAYDLANSAQVLAGVAQKGVRDGIASVYANDIANIPTQVTIKYSNGTNETRVYKAGDVAYITKDNITKIYTYDDSKWVQPDGHISPASITTDMIATGAITAGLIDTESLATNDAFISQLVTTNLDVKDAAGTEIVANGKDGLLVKKSDGTVLMQANNNKLTINGDLGVSNTPIRNYALGTYKLSSNNSNNTTLYPISVSGKDLQKKTNGSKVYLGFDWDTQQDATQLLTETDKVVHSVGTNSSNGNFNNDGGVWYFSQDKTTTIADIYRKYGADTKLLLSFDWTASGDSISGTFNPQLNNTPYGMGDNIRVSPTTSNTFGSYSEIVNITSNFSSGTATAVQFRQDNLIGNITITNMSLIVITSGSFSITTDSGLLFVSTDTTINLTNDKYHGTAGFIGDLSDAVKGLDNSFNLIFKPNNLNGTIDITNLRLMISNTTQDWINAPEDYAQQLSDATNKLNQRVDDTSNAINNLANTTTNSINQMTTDQQDKWKELNGYVNISNGAITLGNNTNQSQVAIDNDEIDFVNSGQTVAKLTGKSLAITDTDASLQLGSFQFQPRKNGNLSFTWVNN